MLKKEYRKMMDQLQPAEDLPARVMEKTNHRHRCHPLAVVVLVILLVVPAMAVQNPETRAWLYDLSNTFAVRFLPVNMSDTCCGITVEVCGLMKEDETDLLPNPAVLLSFYYEDGTPLEDDFAVGNVYFDGATTWDVMECVSYIVPEREETMLMICLQNPGVTLDELHDAVTTVLIDYLIVGENIVEGPWRISFRFSEDLMITQQVN